MAKFPTSSGAGSHFIETERELPLTQSDRADGVFGALLEVLEETPEALSLEYSHDLLCDLVRSQVPDVTIQEIVTALITLSARATALRELMQTTKVAKRDRRC